MNALLGTDHLSGYRDGEPWFLVRVIEVPAFSSFSCSQPTIISNVLILISRPPLSRELPFRFEQIEQSCESFRIMQKQPANQRFKPSGLSIDSWIAAAGSAPCTVATTSNKIPLRFVELPIQLFQCCCLSFCAHCGDHRSMKVG